MREMPKLLRQTADFRVYEQEIVKGPKDKLMVIQLCEDLVEGRWEPFYSTVCEDYLASLKNA